VRGASDLFGIKIAQSKGVYMYPAIDRSSLEPQINVPITDVEPAAPNRADELCDALMEHIFDCDACINGQEDTCAVYCSLREQIAQSGGPTRGAVLVA
jgi:hypothetical protein